MTTRMGVQSTVIYDPQRIHERYGLEPAPDDRLQGAQGRHDRQHPGHPRRRRQDRRGWLQDHGSLDGIYEDLDSIKPDSCARSSREHEDDVLLWRELVTIDRHAPIELDLSDARLGDYDRAEVFRLFREYEFRTLVERLPRLDGEEAPAPGDLLRQADRGAPVPAALVPGRVLAADRAAGGRSWARGPASS